MAVEIKGLTKDERDLISVARYFNTNTAAIEAVIAKLGNEIGFDNGTISAMTGFTNQRVASIVRAHRTVQVKPKSKAQAEFVAEHSGPNTLVIDHLAEPEKAVSKVEEKKTPHNTKYIDVANGIIDLIDELNLDKGDRLPKSDELAEKFGVATGAVSKAVQHLVSKGVVVSTRGKGIFVA